MFNFFQATKITGNDFLKAFFLDNEALLASVWTWMKTEVTTELQESQRSCEVWADTRIYRQSDAGRETDRGWSVRKMEEEKNNYQIFLFLKLFVTFTC